MCPLPPGGYLERQKVDWWKSGWIRSLKMHGLKKQRVREGVNKAYARELAIIFKEGA
jgi:hypothetical protein